MRFNPTKLLEGLLCTAPALLLTLAACGGGGGSVTTTAPVVAPSTAPFANPPVAGCAAISLNWTAVTGATGYNVYGAASSVQVISASNKLTLSPDTATSYTDTTATTNTRYYQITAVNSAGEGPGSNVVSGKITAACTHMGGSIQGNALTLSGAVSTLAGAGPTYNGSTDGTGSAAQFNFPTGATTDGTYLYIADTYNNLIRQIVISTGAVTTIAGAGPTTPGFADGTGTAAKFHGPKGITISPDSTTLYVADTGNNAIRQILISTGAVTTIAGSTAGTSGFADNTTGTSATFYAPASITVDGTNLGANLYVADTGNNAIRQIVINGAAVTTIAGAGPTSPGFVDATGASAKFTAPQGITTNGANLLYVADTGNNAIRQIVISTGAVTTIAGSTAGASGFTDATGTAAKFNYPQGITTDATNLYVGDTRNNAIRQIVINGAAVTTIAGAGPTTPGFVDATGTAAQFFKPAGTTTDGTNLYVVDTSNNAIREIQ